MEFSVLIIFSAIEKQKTSFGNKIFHILIFMPTFCSLLSILQWQKICKASTLQKIKLKNLLANCYFCHYLPTFQKCASYICFYFYHLEKEFSKSKLTKFNNFYHFLKTSNFFWGRLAILNFSHPLTKIFGYTTIKESFHKLTFYYDN